MRLVFFSDIHGALPPLKRLAEWCGENGVDRMFLLGDIFYPRSGTAEAGEAAALLNRFGERLTVIAGNCDDGTDLKMLRRPAARDRAVFSLDGRTFFLTHGHIWNGWNPPPVPAGSVLVHGHTHVPEATETAGGIIIFNPGSIGAPRRGAPPSFGCLEAGRLAVRRLDDGEELMGLDLAARRRDLTAG